MENKQLFDRMTFLQSAVDNVALHLRSRPLLYGLGDSCFTASSEYQHSLSHRAENSRLHTQNTGSHVGSWCAQHNDQNQYIQVDLGKDHLIDRLGIQGRHDFDQWVTSFFFRYKANEECDFNVLRNTDAQEIEFAGARDRHTVIVHSLPEPVIARYVRIHPVAWQQHVSLRWEVYGSAVACQC